MGKQGAGSRMKQVIAILIGFCWLVSMEVRADKLGDFEDIEPTVLETPTPSLRVLNESVASLYDKKRWSFMLFHGKTSSNSLADHLLFQYDATEERLYSAEISYALSQDTSFLALLHKYTWIDVIEFGLNYTYRDDKDSENENISEFVALFMVRWMDFPWDHYIKTTFAIAEGLSYTTDIPLIEHDHASGNPEKLLNYLALELTASYPTVPNWQLVFRLHHRSSIGGLLAEDKYGSNSPGVGLRVKF